MGATLPASPFAKRKRDAIRSRVRRGAKWMDKNESRTWADRINLRRLAMADPCACIGGQLYGEYYLARCRWDMPVSIASALGLTVDVIGDCGRSIRPVASVNVEFDILTEAWREEVLARRTGSAALGRESEDR